MAILDQTLKGRSSGTAACTRLMMKMNSRQSGARTKTFSKIIAASTGRSLRLKRSKLGRS